MWQDWIAKYESIINNNDGYIIGKHDKEEEKNEI